MFAPAATSKAIIALLHDAIVADLQTPETKSWLTQRGAVPVGNTPEQFGAFMKSELARYEPVVKATGAKVD